MDTNGRSATIQLSASQLIEATASNASRDTEAAAEAGWLSRPHSFYLLVECVNPNVTLSDEQLVVREVVAASSTLNGCVNIND